VLVTYFLLVVQFANPSPTTAAATPASAVSTNYTSATHIGQQVVALVIENLCQKTNLAEDASLNMSAILCAGVDK